MAQHLTIAKAALSASLFRADPVSVPRATVDALFPLLHSTLTQCSRPNVQKCKVWVVEYVAPSRSRTAALGKYFVALSKGLEQDGKKPSLRRRRLHVLYIVSDVLHHVVSRMHDDGFGDAFGEHLPALIASAADFKNSPKHMRKLEDLIALWEEKRLVSSATYAKLQAALSGIAIEATTESQTTATSKPVKEAPYILPSFHGDSSTPWYDLPAATWLPHMLPNSTKPMVPSMIKPIQLAPGPADKDLADAVSNLLKDVNRLFSKGPITEEGEQDGKVDVHELGERVVLDEITGDIIRGTTYYGWSRTFCEKMKERKLRAKKGYDRGRPRSNSSELSRGRSRSSSGPPAFKRRRRSSYSRSPHHRSRSRSYSPRRDSQSHSRSQNRGRGRSRSRTPDRRRSYSRSSSRSKHQSYQSHQSQSYPLPPPLQANTTRSQQHSPPPPVPFHPGSLPPPPPPPAGYQGPWPPPPPPPPSHLPNMPSFPMAGGWGQGPPPPPPPPLQQHQPPPPPPYSQYGQPHQDRPGYHGQQGHGLPGGLQGRGGQRGGGYRGRGGNGHRGRGRGWQ